MKADSIHIDNDIYYVTKEALENSMIYLDTYKLSKSNDKLGCYTKLKNKYGSKFDNKINYPSEELMKYYKQGKGLLTSGHIILGIGIPTMITGFVLMKTNPTSKAGAILTTLGTISVSISIPQICFGSHMKKESNLIYNVKN